MRIDDYLDTYALMEEIGNGFVRAQVHPTEPLTIYNYTNKAQYEGRWNDVTKRCRGLIIDTEDGTIVSRPFEKFFNWGQVDRDMLPRGPIRVQDKMDGSLGILYVEPNANRLAIATRGSFTSDQAVHATEVLRTRYEDFRPLVGYTYLFEIIYPENRIVCDYGDKDDLVLLDILHNETGLSRLGAHDAVRETWPGPVVEEFEYDSVVDVLNTEPRPGAEGFVVYFEQDGSRVKIKQDEYVRLHRLLTGVSNKTLWEILANGGDLNEIIDRVPDEYYHWVRNTVAGLQKEFNGLLTESWQIYCAVIRMVPSYLEKGSREHRRKFAQLVKDAPHKSLLFRLYDDKPMDEAIWRLVKPEYSKPFWNVNEDVA